MNHVFHLIDGIVWNGKCRKRITLQPLDEQTSSAVAASRGIDTLGNRMMFVAGTASLVFTKTFLKTAAEFDAIK
ncbi:hypothetical protein BB048_21070 [Vibrio parahaemolyticus]|nr:hypothetical protein [Vibrio parahaemolyticus]OHX42497.1 hypothetical protein BB048_21070 [Vibrio parahaemolyticus]